MTSAKRYIGLVLVLAVVVGAIGLLESRKVLQTGTSVVDSTIELDENARTAEKAKRYEEVKEISSPDAFLNTEPFALADLVGEKVILVDFWTYSCINCQRTLPYLNRWHERYADEGLAIVGVHTPEFEFEKSLDNVRKAVEKFGVKYPVVLDNDYSTWRSYKNRYWPRKYLIDIDGFIVYDHIGEGGYDETEEKIVELLNERNRILQTGTEVVADMGDLPAEYKNRAQTPEIYFGSSRVARLSNLPSSGCLSRTCTYTLPTAELLPNSYVLGGDWQTDDEYIESRGDAVIRLRFSASKVNFVAGADTPTNVEVVLDGKPVGTAAGVDVTDGSAQVSEEGLYNVIDLGDNAGEHVLELRIPGAGLRAFTFTFG